MLLRLQPLIAGLLTTRVIAGGLNVPLPEGNIFDYVIAGGGPAGLTVANRLSEDPNITVLVLEAGPLDQYEEKIMIPYMQGSAGLVNGQCGGYNWCDNTVPQTYLDGATRIIPQGRGLGGGTLINAMFWNRGDREDYDTWAALGNDGWDYESMLPFFQQSETFNAESNSDISSFYSIGEDESQHGFSGPQNVSFPNFFYEASSHFFAAMNQMGIPNVTDPSAPTTKGAMFLPQGISQWNQSRADARRARFDPVSNRPNLYVSTGQHVLRVLFEGGCSTSDNGSLRAVGVESSPGRDMTIWTAVATREVVLAACALRTPQLLELSGIGANDILSSNGIQSRISLPGVGNNLQDHMLLHATQAFNNDSYVYSNIMNNDTIQEWARSLYYTNRTGPYTFGPPDGNAFLSLPQFSNRSSDIAAQAAAQTDDQYLAPGLDPSVSQGFARQRALLIPALNDSGRGAIEYLQDNAGNIQISNQRPLTRGTVHLNSTDPFTYPILDFRYGSNPLDYQVMLEALRFNDALFQQPALQILQPVQNDPPHAASDLQLESFLNRSLGTEYHPCGTAAMLPREDGGVVDSDLMVYGTQNLRVVDASIFPIIPAAHLEAVIYGVCEKAASLIRSAAVPAVTPSMPLNQAMCTTGPSKRNMHLIQNEFPENNIYSKRQDYGSISDSCYPAVGYPNYNPGSARPFDPNDPNRPASVGLPVGAALEWADKIICGVIDLAEGLVGEVLEPILDPLFGNSSYGGA
ncbi:hypothetical protein MBLNU457_7526t1 [Dothideomycetes sp. NU457]